jgi:hypothetical protein
MYFRTRYGVIADKEWLYKLYCSTMRPYVEQTWGWDAEFQRSGFQTLHPTKFRIVIVKDDDVGTYLFSIVLDDNLRWHYNRPMQLESVCEK